MELYSHQIEAVEKMHNGCILCGGVGTGKSKTAIAYYYTKVCDGDMPVNGSGHWGAMRSPRPLYIITTAKKRDSLDWHKECSDFRISTDPSASIQHVPLVIDSWNNISKYRKIFGAFFIFDEQRVVGSGKWVKAFLDIARKNQWILLSATPGDKWIDYIPVFVANGFYASATDFKRQHCIITRYANYPKIEGYINEWRLEKRRNSILIDMPYERHTIPHHLDVWVDYDRFLYKEVWRDRWDPYNDEPIDETGNLFFLLRRVTNSDESRIEEVKRLMQKHSRIIIFYNFDFELDALRQIEGIEIREWNGQKHEAIPDTEKWLYLVQYSAGAEGWNCITTDTIIFYSQNYSYRMTEQASGRIDRLNTPYVDLYYYHFKSHAPIDLAISRALSLKKDFNMRAFLGRKKNN